MENVGDGKVIVVTGGFDSDDGGGGRAVMLMVVAGVSLVAQQSLCSACYDVGGWR